MLKEESAAPKASPIVMKFYHKFEPLTYQYARKVFNYERFGYEFDDVWQEFKIKLYTSILSYLEKWKEYTTTGKYKPVPIVYYIKSAMVNKVKDFVRKFNLEEVANAPKVSIQDNQFDYSETDPLEGTDYSQNFVLNGVDLLENLNPVERIIFILYLKGYTLREIKQRTFKNGIKPVQVIKSQLAYLHGHKAELLSHNHQTHKVFSFDEDMA